MLMDILDLSSNQEQQPYFATYLNMAQNNAAVTLEDIARRFGLNTQTLLKKDYLEKLPADKQEKLKRKLLRSFPFLVPMISTDRFYAFDKDGDLYYAKEKHEKDSSADVTIRKEEELLKNNSIASIAEQLETTLKVLDFYRNNASHTEKLTEEQSNSVKDNSKTIALALDRIFKQACSVIKERFQLTGNDKGGNNLCFIQDNKVAKKKTDKTDQKGRPIFVQVPNFNYSHCFYYKNNRKYTMSKMAVVYLTCMFIEKSYATQFFSQISTEFYKGIYKNEDYKMWLREIYSCYRIRMPKNTTNPYEDNVMLAMDILNEITKSPNELFDCLSRDDKAKFETTINEQDNDSEHEQDDDSERVLLRRSTDRFPELALKWIDGNKVFDDLRFNVIYGKYHEVFKDEAQKEQGIKKCCDGIERPRWITKELTTYGRIDVLEQQRTDKDSSWDGKALVKKLEEDTETVSESETEDLSPWITDMRCQYVIKEGNIGIKITKDDTLPPINGKGLKDIRTSAPDFWLSVYELPAFVFLTLLNAQAAKGQITSFKKRFTSFLQKIKDGTIPPCSNENQLKEVIAAEGFKDKDIPQKIKDCLLGKQHANLAEYAERFLEEETLNTDRRLADLEACKKGNEVIEPSRFLPGNIAKFLSADIVKYCKYSKGSDKPTGLNFNVMQSKLATFANRNQFADIAAMFQKLNMTKGGTAEHPFLQEVIDFNPKNVEQFFAKYLAAKQKFLAKCKIKCVKSDNACQNFHFLHPKRSKWQKRSIDAVVNEYLQLPIQLPKGLFDDKIKETIIKDCPHLKDKETTTTSYMINAYMQYMEDGIQEFYKYGRSYPVFEKMDKAKPGKTRWVNGEVKYRSKEELHKKGFFEAELKQYIRNCQNDPKKRRTFDADSAKEKLRGLYYDYDRTEKAITRYSVQDFLLMQIAKKLIFDIPEGKKTVNDASKLNIKLFKLQEISPEYKGILSESVPITLDIKEGYSVTWQTKIKDYARIFKLYKDKRLKKNKEDETTLLTLLPKGNYLAEDIQWEFENFDRKRIEAFKLVLDLEREAVKIPSVKAAANECVTETGHSNFDVIFSALLDHLKCSETEKAELKMITDIRNSFAHGDYLDIGIKPATLKDASNNIIAKLNELIDKVKAKMSK